MMGEAKRRLEREGEKVTFDCDAIGFRMGKTDRAAFARGLPGEVPGDDEPAKRSIRALTLLSRSVVAAAFPGGMDRRDGKVWAAWQDALDDESPAFEVTRGQLGWLRRHVDSESVKLPPQLAQWRESLAYYLEGLSETTALRAVEDGGA